MTSCCYVSAFFDIGRSSWENNTFKRTFENYLQHFEPFLTLFNLKNCENDEMIVFIDVKYYSILLEKVINTNIKLIPIDRTFLNTNLHCWSTLPREQAIMTSKYFRSLIERRKHFPECNYPEYTLINHCKIDFICHIIKKNLSKKDVFAWVDFGFFSKPENIPQKLLDLSLFDLGKINYTLINLLEGYDFDIHFTLQYGLEKIGGFFFLGTKQKMLEFQKLYHKMLHFFQYIANICDDDQHIVLQCIGYRPDLFSLDLVNLGWHKVLINKQKK